VILCVYTDLAPLALKVCILLPPFEVVSDFYHPTP
jgi:hypothetical protein